MHHQFVASAKAVARIHEIDPEAKVGCMTTKLTYYPYSCKPEDVLATQQRMRQVYAFCDIQVFGEYPAFLAAKFRNSNIDLHITEEDERVMKENPVDFVSFSFYQTSCVAANADGLAFSINRRKYYNWNQEPLSTC